MSMEVCSDGHAEICFDDGTAYRRQRCPACELKDALGEKSNALDVKTDELADLAARVAELTDEIAELKGDLAETEEH